MKRTSTMAKDTMTEAAALADMLHKVSMLVDAQRAAAGATKMVHEAMKQAKREPMMMMTTTTKEHQAEDKSYAKYGAYGRYSDYGKYPGGVEEEAKKMKEMKMAQ